MTSNPMLNSKVTENVILQGAPMTIAGAVNKTLLLLGIVALSGSFTWSLCSSGFHDKAMLLAGIGLIAGFILALITAFKPEQAKKTAPIYAICEGLLVGSVSYAYNIAYHGIVLNAVVITLLTLTAMLCLYKTGTIKATPVFKKTIITSTVAIAIYYFIGIIASFFGHAMNVFNGGGIGIAISVIFCAVAAFNFILDFDFIEQGELNNLPDYFEWYGAFSLLVTVIWLYFEVLKLLAQLNRRR